MLQEYVVLERKLMVSYYYVRLTSKATKLFEEDKCSFPIMQIELLA